MNAHPVLPIEELVNRYGADEVNDHMAIARHQGARHPLNYVNKTLREQFGERNTPTADSRRPTPQFGRCDRCPLTEYINRMAVVGREALCGRCAEQERDRGGSLVAASDDARLERAVVDRERLRELRSEEPCRIVGTPLRCNESPEERAWLNGFRALERDVRQLARRKGPYMAAAALAAEVKVLVDHRVRVELGDYPEQPRPLWRVLLRPDRDRAGGDAVPPPLSATAQRVEAYWRSVEGAGGGGTEGAA